MITGRDKKVIEFLDNFKVATTSTIAELFYPCLRTAQERLLKLYKDYKEVKRTRDHFTYEYIYYRSKKPKQFEHRRLLTDFYREMHKRCIIGKFINEIKVEHLRADGIIAYKTSKIDTYRISFVEIERSQKKFNMEKYLTLYHSGAYKKHGFSNFPNIIIVTNQQIGKCNNFKIIQVKEDLSNIDEIAYFEQQFS